MKKGWLLAQLQNEITKEEAALLRGHRMEHISSSNEAVMLELLDAQCSDDDEICDTDVEKLRKVTYAYLAEYLPEYPSSWKWIFLACAYQTFIRRAPMHAKEWVHYTEQTVNGETIYFCPAKSKEPGTSCSFCVCRFAD